MSRSPRRPRIDRCHVLALLAAWLLFAGQGGMGAAFACPQDAARMSAGEMASMPMMAPATDQCPHCHPKGANSACPGIHGCTGAGAAAAGSASAIRFTVLAICPPAAAPVRTPYLPSAPPLRPPAV
jgi:hypothetical protein